MKLRFTIRDLFWLVLVAVLALEWLFDHRRLVSQVASKESLVASKEGLVAPLQEQLLSAREMILNNLGLVKAKDEEYHKLSNQKLNLYNQLYWIRQRDPKLVEDAEKNAVKIPVDPF